VHDRAGEAGSDALSCDGLALRRLLEEPCQVSLKVVGGPLVEAGSVAKEVRVDVECWFRHGGKDTYLSRRVRASHDDVRGLSAARLPSANAPKHFSRRGDVTRGVPCAQI
jgi:hypothetical protein